MQFKFLLLWPRTKAVYTTLVLENELVASGVYIINVNAAPNMPPTANAGLNQTIPLPINIVTVNGSGTDSDGTLFSYLWTKISGPSDATINNTNSASAIVNNLSEGVYQFELR